MQGHCHTKLLATRCSPFAIRQSLPFLALTGGSCSRTTENKFGCSGEQPSSFVPARPKFFGTAEPCPPEKPFATCYSPFTIRYRFGFNWRVVLQHDRIFSARQKPCPPEKPFATCYSPFTIRYRFGFNWRVVLPHDRNLNKFGCSGEQPSSFVPARPKFFGTAEPCPPEKPSATRHSLFANRCHFGSAGASPSQFIPSPVPRPSPRFKLVAMVTKPAI
jgi:hypothetical protein